MLKWFRLGQLVKRLNTGNAAERLEALQELTTLGHPDAVLHVIEATHSTDVAFRAAAYAALGSFPNDERALQAVLKRLRSYIKLTQDRVVVATIRALAALRMPEGFQELVCNLQPGRAGKEIRLEIANQLKKQGWTPQTTPERAALALAEGRWKDLTREGDAATELLIQFDDRDEQAPMAWKCLCVIQTPRAIGHLLGLIKSPKLQSQPEFREVIPVSLRKAKWTPATAEQRIVLAIAERRWDDIAAEGETAVQFLLDIPPCDPDAFAALQVLERIHGPIAVDELSRRLLNKLQFSTEYMVRLVEVLDQLNDPRALAPVIEILNQSWPGRPEPLDQAAERLVSRWKSSELVATVQRALKDFKWPLMAARILKRWNELPAGSELQLRAAVLLDDVRAVIAAGSEHADQLASMMDGSNSSQRVTLALSLTAIRDKRGIEAIVFYVNDRETRETDLELPSVESILTRWQTRPRQDEFQLRSIEAVALFQHLGAELLAVAVGNERIEGLRAARVLSEWRDASLAPQLRQSLEQVAEQKAWHLALGLDGLTDRFEGRVWLLRNSRHLKLRQQAAQSLIESDWKTESIDDQVLLSVFGRDCADLASLGAVALDPATRVLEFLNLIHNPALATRVIETAGEIAAPETVSFLCAAARYPGGVSIEDKQSHKRWNEVVPILALITRKLIAHPGTQAKETAIAILLWSCRTSHHRDVKKHRGLHDVVKAAIAILEGSIQSDESAWLECFEVFRDDFVQQSDTSEFRDKVSWFWELIIEMHPIWGTQVILSICEVDPKLVEERIETSLATDNLDRIAYEQVERLYPGKTGSEWKALIQREKEFQIRIRRESMQESRSVGSSFQMPALIERVRCILEQSGHRLLAIQLNRLSEMRDPLEIYSEAPRGDMCYSNYYRPVDCGLVRQLARQELIRRSREALPNPEVDHEIP